MRSKVELLKLLRENLHSDYFRSGLCQLINNMLYREIINSEESDVLRRLLYDNLPANSIIGNYWWFPFKRTERDKFLQELIEKYKHD